MNKKIQASLANPAFRFVMMIGIANLFADMTYEGGGSINGQFLGKLGASAAAISIIAGLGEFFGYSLRSLSGYISDKSGKPWLMSFVGYGINLLSVPAMALVHSWQLAALLIFSERIGRAIRKPAVESMLSYTTGKFGRGWVYALNTALDETGATVGPLVAALILFNKGSYRFAYSLLLVSAVLALLSLMLAQIKFPIPSHFENETTSSNPEKFSRSYWIYMLAGAFFASGLLSYELVAFHLLKNGLLMENRIPILLSLATGSGIIANLFIGKFFDRYGLPIVLAAVILSALSPLVFLDNYSAVLFSMPFIGISYATQDTLLTAIIAGLLPKGKRGLAFGLFYTGYGAAWLIGSIIMGSLYDYSRPTLICFAATTQLISLPFFILASRQEQVQAF